MSVTISAVLPSAFDQAGAPSRELEITRDEAIALVLGISKLARDRAGIVFVDDFQCGYVATDVHPDALAEVAKGADPALQAKIAAHLDFAVRNNLLVSVYTNDDVSYRQAAPTLVVTGVEVSDPQVTWSGGHAVEAFRNVGFRYDADNPAGVSARALRDACEKRLDKVSDMDTARLYEIAEYALSKGGPDVEVLAA
ncbi:hypothetical protein [Microvirga massiliensis]|uniref:hypothetical protein n=1 Tax=Microvirga massiliensis TaxID=1033741 RepID=UPI00062B7E47|nr:hypothetical protein [Microvirga massiliensis]